MRAICGQHLPIYFEVYFPTYNTVKANKQNRDLPIVDSDGKGVLYVIYRLIIKRIDIKKRSMKNNICVLLP